MLNLILRLIFLGLLLGLLAGCGTPPARSGKPKVLATTGMIGSLVKSLAGDEVEVDVLIPAGVDPHLYKASPMDVQRLREAEVIFTNGLHLEGKMAEVFANLGRTKPVIAVTEGLPGTDPVDPHAWMNVQLWAKTLPKIKKALADNLPAISGLDHRTQSTAAELNALHAEVQEILSPIPADRRILITAHDAFRYFGRAYGLEVYGVQGLSTESEAGLKEINALVDLLVERKIPAVFIESTLSPRSVQALTEGAQARGHAVKIGGSLYSDALGEPGSGAETYAGMIRHNAKTIAEALR